MQLDPNIILGAKPAQFENPANQLAKLLQVQEMQQMGRAREMQMQDAMQSRERSNRLQSLLSNQYETPEARESALLQGGFMEEAGKLQTGRLAANKATTEADKVKFEQAKQRLEIMGQTFGYVRQNPTPENAMSAIQFLAQNGIMTPEQAQQAAAQIQSDPSKVGQLADMAFRSVLSAKEQLPKFEVRDTGGAVQTLQIDPITGSQATAASIAKTQSPDSIANMETARRGQDITARGQNMADARARERLAFDKAGGAGGASGVTAGASNAKLTESEGKNTLYLSQMRDASNTLDKLEKASPIAVAATGSTYTNWMAGKNAQKVGQTQRQWAEAYLRAKTGAAATAGEVDNNIRTFFPVVGDDEETINQKAQARRQAENDMEIPAGRGAERAVKREGSAPQGFKIIGVK